MTNCFSWVWYIKLGCYWYCRHSYAHYVYKVVHVLTLSVYFIHFGCYTLILALHWHYRMAPVMYTLFPL